MSLTAIRWAFEQAPVSRCTDLLVLVALADYADDAGGRCWPSVPTIARKTRLTPRAVYASLQRLKSQRLLAVEDVSGGRKTNTYRLLLEAPRGSAPPEPHSPLNKVQGGQVNVVQVRGEQGSSEPLNDVPKPPEPRSPDPLLNHHVDPPVTHGDAEAFWHAWRTAAERHHARQPLVAGPSDASNIRQILTNYRRSEWEPAIAAWWDAEAQLVGGRNLGLFRAQVPELLEHLARRSGRRFRDRPAAGAKPDRRQLRIERDEWVCPHDPHCGSRSYCERQSLLDEGKREIAADRARRAACSVPSGAA